MNADKNSWKNNYAWLLFILAIALLILAISIFFPAIVH